MVVPRQPPNPSRDAPETGIRLLDCRTDPFVVLPLVLREGLLLALARFGQLVSVSLGFHQEQSFLPLDLARGCHVPVRRVRTTHDRQPPSAKVSLHLGPNESLIAVKQRLRCRLLVPAPAHPDRFAAGHPEVIRRHRHVVEADEVGQLLRDSMSSMSSPVNEQNAPRTATPLVLTQGVQPCCFHADFLLHPPPALRVQRPWSRRSPSTRADSACVATSASDAAGPGPPR